jgi:hypothetical protein
MCRSEGDDDKILFKGFSYIKVVHLQIKHDGYAVEESVK